MNITITLNAPAEVLEAMNNLAAALRATAPAETVQEKPAKKSKAAPAETAPAEPVAQTESAPAAATEPAWNLEQVRAKMAELSQAGKRAEVKALLADFGASSVSSLDPAHYYKVMAQAEAL